MNVLVMLLQFSFVRREKSKVYWGEKIGLQVILKGSLHFQVHKIREPSFHLRLAGWEKQS